MREYSATDLANKTGDVLAAAAQGPVQITRHGKPRFVLLSLDRFDDLAMNGDGRRAVSMDELADEEADEIIGALERGLANE